MDPCLGHSGRIAGYTETWHPVASEKGCEGRQVRETPIRPIDEMRVFRYQSTQFCWLSWSHHLCDSMCFPPVAWRNAFPASENSPSELGLTCCAASNRFCGCWSLVFLARECGVCRSGFQHLHHVGRSQRHFTHRLSCCIEYGGRNGGGGKRIRCFRALAVLTNLRPVKHDDLDVRNVSHGGDGIRRPVGSGNGTLIEVHFFIKGNTDTHHCAAFHLALQLFRVDDDPGLHHNRILFHLHDPSRRCDRYFTGTGPISSRAEHGRHTLATHCCLVARSSLWVRCLPCFPPCLCLQMPQHVQQPFVLCMIDAELQRVSPGQSRGFIHRHFPGEVLLKLAGGTHAVIAQAHRQWRLLLANLVRPVAAFVKIGNSIVETHVRTAVGNVVDRAALLRRRGHRGKTGKDGPDQAIILHGSLVGIHLVGG